MPDRDVELRSLQDVDEAFLGVDPDLSRQHRLLPGMYCLRTTVQRHLMFRCLNEMREWSDFTVNGWRGVVNTPGGGRRSFRIRDGWNNYDTVAIDGTAYQVVFDESVKVYHCPVCDRLMLPSRPGAICTLSGDWVCADCRIPREQARSRLPVLGSFNLDEVERIFDVEVPTDRHREPYFSRYGIDRSIDRAAEQVDRDATMRAIRREHERQTALLRGSPLVLPEPEDPLPPRRKGRRIVVK